MQFACEVGEKQRADQFEDVLFAGVMGAGVAGRLGIHHRLEHRAENGRADPAPVEDGGVDQQRAHVRVERGQRQRLGKQAAVDVRELGRSEEHTSELQSLMRISYAVFCLKKKNIKNTQNSTIKSAIKHSTV